MPCLWDVEPVYMIYVYKPGSKYIYELPRYIYLSMNSDAE